MKPAPPCELMTHTKEDIAQAKKRQRWLVGCGCTCLGVSGLLVFLWAFLNSL